MSTTDAPPRHLTRGGTALAAAPVRPQPRPARRTEVAPRRHLRVVGPADRVRRRLTPRAGVVLTVLTFVTLLLVTVAHTLLVQGQIQLDELDAQLRVEQARYQELRKDVAEMESPTRVVAAAEELGMVMPEDLVYLQPTAPVPADVDPVPVVTGAEVAAAPQSTWSTIKPLLEALAP
jgi:cell division protein FtsL